MEEQENKVMEAKAEDFKKKLDMISESCAEIILEYLRDNQDKPDAKVKEYIKETITAHTVLSMMIAM